jgi:hypothetical protein
VHVGLHVGRILRSTTSSSSSRHENGMGVAPRVWLVFCTALVSFRLVATEASLHSDIWTNVLGS